MFPFKNLNGTLAVEIFWKKFKCNNEKWSETNGFGVSADNHIVIAAVKIFSLRLNCIIRIDFIGYIPKNLFFHNQHFEIFRAIKKHLKFSNLHFENWCVEKRIPEINQRSWKVKKWWILHKFFKPVNGISVKRKFCSPTLPFSLLRPPSHLFLPVPDPPSPAFYSNLYRILLHLLNRFSLFM